VNDTPVMAMVDTSRSILNNL